MRAVVQRRISSRSSLRSILLPMVLDRLTEGYSSSDLTSLAKDAALGPIRGKPGVRSYPGHGENTNIAVYHPVVK